MSEDLMLKCLIAFILGWLVSRMMGNGFSVGGENVKADCPTILPDDIEYCNDCYDCGGEIIRWQCIKENKVINPLDNDCSNLYS